MYKFINSECLRHSLGESVLFETLCSTIQDHSDPEFNHDPEVCYCEEQVTKTKKILSANNEAGFHGMILVSPFTFLHSGRG